MQHDFQHDFQHEIKHEIKHEIQRTRSSPRSSPIQCEQLLTPREVAARFHVDPKTVTRWAIEGKLTARRTLGGHRRYLDSEITHLLGASDVR